MDPTRPDPQLQLSLTHTAHVHARGRPWTHVAAVARNNANYANTSWYCAILRAVATKVTQHHAQIEPCTCAVWVRLWAYRPLCIFTYQICTSHWLFKY